MDSSNTFRVVAIVVTAAILVYVLWDYGARRRSTEAEKFDYDAVETHNSREVAPNKAVRKEVRFDGPDQGAEGFDPAARVPGTLIESLESENSGVSHNATEVDFPVARQMPENCYPRERLTAEDLLPKDAANSKWAMVNPAGQGDLRDRNFLTAGYHVGINTVGTSLRNPNMSLRSEPSNPQGKVSPWQNSTIMPDLLRKPLDVAGECA